MADDSRYPSCAPPCTDRLHTVVCQLLRRRPGQPMPTSPLEPSILGVTEAMLRNVATAAHMARTASPRYARTASSPALVLLEEAIAAVTSPRPLCQEQLPIDGHPTPAALRCDLPAGHHSQEHYDRASGRVWLLPGHDPHPHPEPGPPDEPWHPDRP